MGYKKIEGAKRNSFIYFVGELDYMQSGDHRGFIYLMCKCFKLYNGTVKINTTTELVEPREITPVLEKIRQTAAETQQLLRQVYISIIQPKPENVKMTLTFPKSKIFVNNKGIHFRF